jgi:putative Mg2+ transporter-C (MgtC) family protein
MLTLSQMVIRLVVAMLLGALMGWEREVIGKEAGIRTSMLVAAGAAIFAILGLTLPHVNLTEGVPELLARSTGAMNVIANIVIGVGFLGAGIIFKDKERVHGLTTAAVVWAVAALGALCGVGLVNFAIAAGLVLTFMLYVLRRTVIHPSAGPD